MHFRNLLRIPGNPHLEKLNSEKFSTETEFADKVEQAIIIT